MRSCSIQNKRKVAFAKLNISVHQITREFIRFIRKCNKLCHCALRNSQAFTIAISHDKNDTNLEKGYEFCIFCDISRGKQVNDTNSGPKLVTVPGRSSIVSAESWQESFSQTYISGVTCDRNNVIRSSAFSLRPNRLAGYWFFFPFFFENFLPGLRQHFIFLAILLSFRRHIVYRANRV